MLHASSSLVKSTGSPGRSGCIFSKLEFRRGGFSPWDSPAVLDGLAGTRVPKPVWRYPLAGAWRELQLRTCAVGWCGGMPGVYSGITSSQGVPFGRLHVLLSLTFSIQYPPEGPAKHGTPAQNMCYPLSCRGCMSSKLDFRGVDKAFGQERVRYWGILQRKIRLSECTELGFVDFPGS